MTRHNSVGYKINSLSGKQVKMAAFPYNFGPSGTRLSNKLGIKIFRAWKRVEYQCQHKLQQLY